MTLTLEFELENRLEPTKPTQPYFQFQLTRKGLDVGYIMLSTEYLDLLKNTKNIKISFK